MATLELTKFLELVSVIKTLPVDVGTPLLIGMMDGFDEITCTEPLNYDDVCETLRWISIMKDYGKEVKLSKETARKMVDAFEGDRKLVVGEWIIRLTLKR